MQCAGNGGGGHGQGIHLGFYQLELILMGHSEALFLIDDQKPQIRKDHPLCQNAVGSYNDIRLSRRQVLFCRFHFLCGAKTAHKLYFNGITLEALGEGVVMLKGEDRGGDEDCHLLWLHHGFKGGSHCHLRLAVAHISQKQSVHGGSLFHIRLYLLGAFKLILGGFEFKGGLEFALEGGVRTEGISLLGLPCRIHRKIFLRQFLDGLFHLPLCRRPIPAAETVYSGGRVGRTHIFLQKIHLLRGNIEGVLLSIAYLDIIPAYPLGFDAHNPLIPPYAVGFVNHIIPGVYIRKEFLAYLRRLPAGGAFGHQIAKGDQNRSLGDKIRTSGKLRLGEGEFPRGHKGAVFQVIALEKGGEALLFLLATVGYYHPVTRGPIILQGG